jgi:hypothetical protein
VFSFRSFWSCVVIASMLARAASMVTPGFSRASAVQL